VREGQAWALRFWLAGVVVLLARVSCAAQGGVLQSGRLTARLRRVLDAHGRASAGGGRSLLGNVAITQRSGHAPATSAPGPRSYTPRSAGKSHVDRYSWEPRSAKTYFFRPFLQFLPGPGGASAGLLLWLFPFLPCTSPSSPISWSSLLALCPSFPSFPYFPPRSGGP
jgi:hypothetical protein